MWQAYRNNSQKLVLFFMWVPRLPLYHCPNKKFQNNNFFLAAIARYIILPSIHPIIDVKILHFFFFDTAFCYVVLADLELKDLSASAPPSDGIKDLQHHTQPQMSKSSHRNNTIIILVHRHFKKICNECKKTIHNVDYNSRAYLI